MRSNTWLERGYIQKLEIAHCKEVFGSPLLHNLLKAVKQLKWGKVDHSKTRNIPKRRPKLNASFFAPLDEQYKRKQHVMKILGREKNCFVTGPI